LAQVGYERVREIENPELASERARELYQAKGYPQAWIEKRLRSIAVRGELTDEWKSRGVQEGREYAILTAEITKATFGVTSGAHRRLKALDTFRTGNKHWFSPCSAKRARPKSRAARTRKASAKTATRRRKAARWRATPARIWKRKPADRWSARRTIWRWNIPRKRSRTANNRCRCDRPVPLERLTSFPEEESSAIFC
jgi:hypothetical protein